MDFYLYLLTFIFLLKIKKLLLYFNILLRNSFIPLFKANKVYFDRSGIPKIREWNSENTGVEFRKTLIFKGRGIPNKVFLEFLWEWNSENEKILNSLGEWNSENERFFRCFFSYLKIREWNSENGRSGIPKI